MKYLLIYDILLGCHILICTNPQMISTPLSILPIIIVMTLSLAQVVTQAKTWVRMKNMTN